MGSFSFLVEFQGTSRIKWDSNTIENIELGKMLKYLFLHFTEKRYWSDSRQNYSFKVACLPTEKMSSYVLPSTENYMKQYLIHYSNILKKYFNFLNNNQVIKSDIVLKTFRKRARKLKEFKKKMSVLNFLLT